MSLPKPEGLRDEVLEISHTAQFIILSTRRSRLFIPLHQADQLADILTRKAREMEAMHMAAVGDASDRQ